MLPGRGRKILSEALDDLESSESPPYYISRRLLKTAARSLRPLLCLFPHCEARASPTRQGFRFRSSSVARMARSALTRLSRERS